MLCDKCGEWRAVAEAWLPAEDATGVPGALAPGHVCQLCMNDMLLQGLYRPYHSPAGGNQPPAVESKTNGGEKMAGLTSFDVDAEGGLPPFITRDEVVEAELVEAVIEPQKELPENSQNTRKVNILVKATVNGKRAKRTVALYTWQVNQIAADFEVKKPSDLAGKKIYLFPRALMKGPYRGTNVIHASAEKPKKEK